MSAEELLIRTMAQVFPLLPYMLVVAISSAIVLPVLLILSRGLWADQRRFRFLSLFFALSARESICLACVWIKLLLLVSFLVSFQKLDVPQYLLFFLPGAIYVLWTRRKTRLLGRALWLVLESAALMSCSLICGYIQYVHAGLHFIVVYVIMAVFTALFGVNLFLLELDDISAGRKMDLEHDRQTTSDT